MMSVLEYAEDVSKSVEEILNLCSKLDIDVSNGEDMLDDEAITLLDNNLELEVEDDTDDEELEEEVVKSATKDVKKSSKISRPNKANKEEFMAQKKEIYKKRDKLSSDDITCDNRIVLYKDGMTIKELSDGLLVSSAEVIKKLFLLGKIVNVNTTVTFEEAELIVSDYDKELKKQECADITNFEEFVAFDKEEDLVERAPVVTIMGHVDHGKTTLLDTIRKTSVAEGEAGGITQSISAYQTEYNGKKITFIDTPGHAAFTEMRARGASITDIVIIIVAADDGVMPQTKEAIDHAKASGVPIIVAINKMDRPGANSERIMTELSEYGLMPDEWGGDTLFSKVVAINGDGIDALLENILLISEMQEYKANPNRYALGTVVESRLDKCLGPVVTLLIQNGTLRLGDPLVVGCYYGKVRTMRDDLGNDIASASPSQPVEITGLNGVPFAGNKFMAFENEKEARNVGEIRKKESRMKEQAPKSTSISLEDVFSKIKEGTKEVNVLVKADVHGSAEAIKATLEKLELEEVKLNVVRSSVGGITESDIVLAKASNAVIIGFNVRPNKKIQDYAKHNGVEIRLYNIIYKIVEDMEQAMKGMLEPVFEEKVLGSAEVRQLFKFSKVGTIAGSYIIDGKVKSKSKVRIIRDDIVIYDGIIESIQREKDTVKEVKKGLECGITIENYNDIKQGDIIESYELVEVER